MATTSLLSAVSRRLEGKAALITGGASGIGRRTAEIFAQHGAKLVIADVQDELGHSVSQSISSSGAKNDVTYVHCDVTDENQVKAAVEKAVNSFGKLDIMFNNAGIIGDSKFRLVESDKDDFEHVLRVNVTGVFLGIKHAAQAMISANNDSIVGGSIISTASVSASLGGTASYAYTCSKSAVLGLTRNAAVELGQFGIRVNCVSPFTVATPMSKEFTGFSEEEVENMSGEIANLKHVRLKADDIANAALFLGNDEGRYVSGHNLVVDGGMVIVNPSFTTLQQKN
ncbi:secoisolariciresinol dehydrogenase-like [Humulus lupulus]|uniref:secoisolariciresinol dehydrogenase-like n=1 Tax=Humulus lupulus TaxID=3486 RepID=UPI002B416138|nr:secoisolariciresinol dehydrogenase-like [Humulus lupulus]